MTTYFNKIDKIAGIIQTLLVLGFIATLYASQRNFLNISVIELLLGILVMHLLVSVRLQSLKQNAMIRWIKNNSE